MSQAVSSPPGAAFPGPPEDVLRAMAALPGLVNGDPGLLRRGRRVDVDWLLEAGGVPFYLSMRAGRVEACQRGPALMRPWRFGIRITAEALRRFWRPLPEPGWHDLFALTKRGEASLEGDLQPLLANLQYFKDVLAAPRGHAEKVQ